MGNTSNLCIEDLFQSAQNIDPVKLSISLFEQELLILKNYGLDIQSIADSSLNLIKFSLRIKFDIIDVKKFEIVYKKEVEEIYLKSGFLNKEIFFILISAMVQYIYLTDLNELLEEKEIYEFSNYLSSCTGIIIGHRLNDNSKSLSLESPNAKNNENFEINEDLHAWCIQPPKRIQGYALALIRALQFFNKNSSHTRPTARDVLEYFRENVRSEPNAWPEIVQVNVHELAFYDSRGDVATADLEALRKAISRYTSIKNRKLDI